MKSKQQKREEADARNQAYRSLTTDQKLSTRLEVMGERQYLKLHMQRLKEITAAAAKGGSNAKN